MLLLIQASEANSEPSQAYDMGILKKIVNSLYGGGWSHIRGDKGSIYLDNWISDTSDPTDLKIEKLCFVPLDYLDPEPLDPG